MLTIRSVSPQTGQYCLHVVRVVPFGHGVYLEDVGGFPVDKAGNVNAREWFSRAVARGRPQPTQGQRWWEPDQDIYGRPLPFPATPPGHAQDGPGFPGALPGPGHNPGVTPNPNPRPRPPGSWRPPTQGPQPRPPQNRTTPPSTPRPPQNRTTPPSTNPPTQGTSDPYGFTDWLNKTRARYGLRPVTYVANLSAWAGQNNNQQNRRGLGHYVMGPARRQNSGMGPYASMPGMWMASPPHRAALLDPSITRIGIAGSGSYWTFNAN